MPSNGSEKSPGDSIKELKTLVVDYARQETVDPLKGLGRYLAFGVAGSLLIAVGTVLLLLALLRGLQLIDTFNTPGAFNGGRWSWAPYFVTVAAGLVVVALAAWKITKEDTE